MANAVRVCSASSMARSSVRSQQDVVMDGVPNGLRTELKSWDFESFLPLGPRRDEAKDHGICSSDCFVRTEALSQIESVLMLF